MNACTWSCFTSLFCASYFLQLHAACFHCLSQNYQTISDSVPTWTFPSRNCNTLLKQPYLVCFFRAPFSNSFSLSLPSRYCNPQMLYQTCFVSLILMSNCTSGQNCLLWLCSCFPPPVIYYLFHFTELLPHFLSLYIFV